MQPESKFIIRQKEICDRYKVPYQASSFDKIIGVAVETFGGKNNMPINGLRHPIEADHSTGWFIWAGDKFLEDTDFFKPMHMRHLIEIYPAVLDYLGLPPGWRFLIDDKGYEDVWYDEKLLDI